MLSSCLRMLVLTVQSVMPWMALLSTKVISEKERCGSHCQLFLLTGLFADVHSRGSKRTVTVARMLEVGVFLF